MPQRDRAALDVQALGVEAQLAIAGDDLGGEGLVDLDEVEVREPEGEPLEQPLHGGHDADPHDVGIDARRSDAQDPRHGLDPHGVARSRDRDNAAPPRRR